MLRKFIVVFLVVCMVSSSFVFAGATSIEEDNSSDYFDVLGYTGKLQTSLTWDDFSLPHNMYMRYVDVILSCSDLTSVRFGYRGSNETELTVDYIGTDSNGLSLYRAYGEVTLNANYFSLRLTRSSSTVYFYQIHIYSITTLKSDLNGGCNISSTGFTGTPIVYRPDDPTNSRSWVGASSDAYGDTGLSLYASDWKSYDYIDFLLMLSLHDVTSISSSLNEVSVPFYVSYLDNSVVGDNVFLINIRIDVRGLDKNTSENLIVYIFGHESFIKPNVVNILEITGLITIDNIFSMKFFVSRIHFYVNAINTTLSNLGTWISNQTSAIGGFFSNLISSLSNWFTTLFSDLNDIKNSLTGTVEDGEEIQENIDNSKQEMQDYKDAMESLPVPDIDDVDLDLDDNSGNAAITSVGRVLAIGINNEVTLPIFMLLFTFAMVGYALYGKR